MDPLVWRKLRARRIWERILIERLTEPLHLNLVALGVAALGGLRAKVAFDLVVRHHTAFGLLTAADRAGALGNRAMTALEFGVGEGAGLVNMAQIARRVSRETGMAIDVVGFDTGAGMPQPRDHRDHPEYYTEGDFRMAPEALRGRLPASTELILGEIGTTLPAFQERLSCERPVGYVAVDLDYYWSTVECLRLFADEEPRKFLPITVVYLDDVALEGHNPFAGELLAVAEFNRDHELRKIAPMRFLQSERVFKHAEWLGHMYALHVLDHPSRTVGSARRRAAESLGNPYLDGGSGP